MTTFIASVYVASLLVDATGAGGLLGAYASLAEHFELLGYIVVASFAISWLAAAATELGTIAGDPLTLSLRRPRGQAQSSS